MADTLQSRLAFGTTGMEVSRIGIGSWAFSGAEGGWRHGFGPQDDDASVATIHAAVEAGVNWVDTAAVYGRGHAETVVGRAVRELTPDERPYVFTKIGRQWRDDDPSAPLESRLSPARLREETEQSLRRLGAERLDLLQVHWPATDGTPVEEYWGVLVQLRDEGKIRAAGLSNHSGGQLEAAHAVGRVDSLQLPFSVLRRDAGAADIPWCRAHDVAFLAYSPLASGLLTGRMSAERVRQLPEADWRRRSDEFSGERLERNLRVAGVLGNIAARRGVSASAVAIAWVLAWPGVTGAIAGARSPGQLGEWVTAAAIELTAEDLREIAGALAATGAGSGPVSPAARAGAA